jgi:hypothetical protein
MCFNQNVDSSPDNHRLSSITGKHNSETVLKQIRVYNEETITAWCRVQIRAAF